MPEAVSPLRPGPEHQRVGEAVGRWQVDCTYFTGPGMPPIKAKAHDTIERVGPFWTISHFKSELMGAAFVGRAAVGYDPIARQWVSTWIDSMSPFLFVLRGNFDASGRVLTLAGEARAATGEPLQLRTREQHLDKDQRVLEMFQVAGDGSETPMFRFVYTRLP